MSLVEAAFDAVAPTVERGVVGNGHLAIALGGDDRGGEQGARRVGILGSVGDGSFGSHAFEQGGRALDLGRLAGGEEQTQGTTQRVTKQMDLRG